ncbi:hypothetical protein RRG08_048956 [Elysia crispata]|uniref:Uncharacterized protein n=1 Tax=Elysia crispata TaxID=231223 RepID=A0AAE0YCC1_9GAST|nr:hypothetical protein RRG08_048956 [Elysia crispata]
MFVRYVGNRLHIMFHMDDAIIHYLNVLLEYLKESCKSEFSRKFLIAQLNNEDLISQLQAISLVGKLITGPWMRFMYKNKDDLSNLQMSEHFRTAQLMIEAWTTNPSEMVSSDKDVFLQPVDHDAVIESLRSPISIGVQVVLKAILPSISSVITRQLGRYLSGDLSNPNHDLLAKTASAAPHNIWAERVIDMTCQLWKRCPMATAGFLDSKIKAKTNKTMDWLDGKERVLQEQLASLARRRAGVLRKRKKEIERGVDEEIEGRKDERGSSSKNFKVEETS